MVKEKSKPNQQLKSSKDKKSFFFGYSHTEFHNFYVSEKMG